MLVGGSMTIVLAFSMMFLLVAADQVIKIWAVTHLSQINTIPLIQDVLHLTYVENRGAAFGIMQGKTTILLIVTSIFLLAILVAILIKKIQQPFYIWMLSLIVAGGVGNLIDRAFRGFVVDYIDFRLIGFPVFNLADCCVVVGILAVVIYQLLVEELLHRKSNESQPPQ